VTRAERYLYHQVHPLKLLVDFATSFASTWLLWEARWALAAVVALPPSVVASALVWRTDLTRFERAPIGRYVARHMTRGVEALRFAGQFVMWIGAAAHVLWVIPLGFLVIVFGWLSGFWTPSSETT